MYVNGIWETPTLTLDLREPPLANQSVLLPHPRDSETSEISVI